MSSSHPRRSTGLAAPASIAAIMLLAGTAASVMAQPAAVRFGREGTVKVRLPRSAGAPANLSRSMVARYDAFSVYEVPANAIPAGDGVEVMTDENRILLNAGALDTSTPAVKALQRARGEFTGKEMQLVQFAGPVQPVWYDQLVQTGVEIVTYIPSNAYLVYGDSKQLAKLQALASTDPHFQWNGAYTDMYRLDPGAVALMNDPQHTTATNQLFVIQLVQDAPVNQTTLALVETLRTGPVVRSETSLNYYNVIAPIPPVLLGTIAARPDVVSIQPYYTSELFDERQDQIVAGNLTGNLPTAPGYLAWLASKGFTQAQFTASGFAVDVSDSGIDNATTSPNHFGLYVSGTRPGTSRIIYNRLVGTPHSGSTLQGCDGHGNLNTHIVLGWDNTAGFPFADAAGYHYGLGVCPFTQAGSSVIFDPSSFTAPNYANLQSQAYNNGARISTNSWGNTAGNTYNTDSQSYDALVRDAQPAGSTVPAAGNQEMVIVFAAGNSGSGGNTVHPPGTGKNLFVIGAAENVQAFGGSDGCGEPDSLADSANDIATFSSRGPCSDGRKKPDICAPGVHISGGVAQTASPAATGTHNSCYTGSGVCGGVGSIYFPPGQEFYTASSGTSHSTPCVAGGSALVRQFFINQGMTAPSPAMTKSFLMNSARYMTGTGANDTLYSNNQGMGEMNLGEAFNRGAVTPTIFRDEIAADMFTASGQSRVFTGNIADISKPLRVTLAWTDAPGATSGTAAKNNLDLTVTLGALTYKGNVFSGANSVTGGAADTLNNVESVFLPNGFTGAVTITVTATNINSDGVPNVGGALDQDFALVAYNVFNPPPPPANDTCANAIAVTVGSTPFTTVNATTDGPSEPGCNFPVSSDPQINQDVWFSYIATCTGMTTASTCGANYDSKIAIYAGGCPSVGSAIACNDDSDACGVSSLQSTVSWPTTAGSLYTIRVGGYLTATGSGNLTISCATCYPNCDGSTTPPILNVLDFACFLNRYAAGDTYANCDNSTTPPTLNVLDFACFLNSYAAGCS